MHHRILPSDMSADTCMCDNYVPCSSILLACESCAFKRAVLRQYIRQHDIEADELCSEKFWNHRMERLHEYMVERWPRLKKRLGGKRVFQDGVRLRTETTIAIIEAIENGRAQAVVELFYKDEENDPEQFE